jgi:hypothetical protein
MKGFFGPHGRPSAMPSCFSPNPEHGHCRTRTCIHDHLPQWSAKTNNLLFFTLITPKTLQYVHVTANPRCVNLRLMARVQ